VVGIAAKVFGLVEGAVGLLEQKGLIEWETGGPASYSDADGDDTVRASGMRNGEIRHGLQNVAGDGLGSGGVGHGHEDDELFAAETSDEVSVAM
jgi:hypothetical protein